MESYSHTEVNEQFQDFQDMLSRQLEFFEGEDEGWFATVNSGILGIDTVEASIQRLTSEAYNITKYTYSTELNIIRFFRGTLI